METRHQLIRDSMSTTTDPSDMAGGTHPATKLFNVVPRPMRRLMVIQFAVGGLILFIWVHYNGGKIKIKNRLLECKNHLQTEQDFYTGSHNTNPTSTSYIVVYNLVENQFLSIATCKI